MRKRNFLLMWLMVLSLVVSGCAAFQTAGSDVEEFICDPPADVVALAIAADPFLSAAASAGGSVATLAYQGAVAILSNGTACATVKQVNALIAFLSNIKTKAMAPAFDVTPLEKWLKSKGK